MKVLLLLFVSTQLLGALGNAGSLSGLQTATLVGSRSQFLSLDSSLESRFAKRQEECPCGFLGLFWESDFTLANTNEGFSSLTNQVFVVREDGTANSTINITTIDKDEKTTCIVNIYAEYAGLNFSGCALTADTVESRTCDVTGPAGTCSQAICDAFAVAPVGGADRDDSTLIFSDDCACWALNGEDPIPFRREGTDRSDCDLDGVTDELFYSIVKIEVDGSSLNLTSFRLLIAELLGVRPRDVEFLGYVQTATGFEVYWMLLAGSQQAADELAIELEDLVKNHPELFLPEFVVVTATIETELGEYDTSAASVLNILFGMCLVIGATLLSTSSQF